jgi:hypothetical protein
VIDWSDMGPIYQSVLFSSLETIPLIDRHVPKIRELFSLGLSEFEPANVEEFLQMIKDRRLQNLRKFIADAADKNTSFDYKFVQQTLRQLHAHQKLFSRTGTIINGAAVGAGLIAACFDGGFTLAALSTVGIGGGQELVSRTITDLIDTNIGSSGNRVGDFEGS